LQNAFFKVIKGNSPAETPVSEQQALKNGKRRGILQDLKARLWLADKSNDKQEKPFKARGF
jgi:hypothetical protein